MTTLAAIPSSCAWCTGSAHHPRWPECDCRTECKAAQCLPGFPARDLEPGMAIWHPDGGSGPGALDVTAVSGPDDAGMMRLGSPDGTATVAADWRVTLYTAADADFAAVLLMDAREAA